MLGPVTDTTSPPDDPWSSFGPPDPTAESRRKVGVPELISIGLGVVVVVGLILMWPSGSGVDDAKDDLDVLGIPSEFHEAVVTDLAEFTCSSTNEFVCVRATFEIATGPDAGRLFSQEFPQIDTSPKLTLGQKVILSRVSSDGVIIDLTEGPCDFDPESECTQATIEDTQGRIDTLSLFPGQEQDLVEGQNVILTYESDGTIVALTAATIQAVYQYADSQRRSYVFVIVVVFVLAVIALGRWRGVAAVTGLGLSLAIVVCWLIPSLLDGNPPAAVAFIGAAAVAYLALYVSHGVTRTSTIALLGTVAALGLTTVLSMATVALGNFTGFTSEESTLLLLLDGIDVRSLLLAGMVIGAAGALDDVTVTQSTAVFQIRAASPHLSTPELFTRGMAIGKAHVGSIVNTLVLAYVGAALPLTILFAIADQSFGSVVNSEVVAVEITRTIVGTLGIIAAVPLTTWFATIWPGSPASHLH